MKETHLVGIDLGTKKLALAVGTREEGRIKILYYNEFPSDGISHSKILNTAKLSKALRSAVDMAGNCLGVKITAAKVGCQKYEIHQSDSCGNVTLGGDQYVTREVLDNLEQNAWEEIGKNLDEGDEILGTVAQGFSTDDEICICQDDVMGMISSQVGANYKIYTGRKSAKRNIEAAFAECAIADARMEFDPLTPGAVLLSENERRGGVALVDFGAGATSVSIFSGGTLRHYAGIPFGGRNITLDIQNVCGISETLAENIKLQYGGCLPNELGSMGEKTIRITDKDSGKKTEITVKDLSETITARVREILDAVLWEIQQSGFADSLRCGIVVTGGCAPMLNLCPMIKKISGYSARIAAPSVNMFDADMTFFTPGASAVAALLLKLSETSPTDCTTEKEEEKKTVETPHQEPAAQEESEGGAKENEPAEKEEEGEEEPWFGNLFSLGKKKPKAEKKPKQPSKPKEPKQENEGTRLFEGLFGDDENNNEDDMV